MTSKARRTVGASSRETIDAARSTVRTRALSTHASSVGESVTDASSLANVALGPAGHPTSRTSARPAPARRAGSATARIEGSGARPARLDQHPSARASSASAETTGEPPFRRGCLPGSSGTKLKLTSAAGVACRAGDEQSSSSAAMMMVPAQDVQSRSERKP